MADEFLGSQMSLIPSRDELEGLSFVSGSRAVAHRILAILTIKKGELPLLPSLGIRPELFAPYSSQGAYAFRFAAEETIAAWNQKAKMGIESFTTRTIDSPQTGEVSIEVSFTTVASPYGNVLTFGYWEFVKSVDSGNFPEFAQKVLIEGFA